MFLIKIEIRLGGEFRIESYVAAHWAAYEIDTDFQREQTFDLPVQRFEFLLYYQGVGCFVISKGFVLELPEYNVLDHFDLVLIDTTKIAKKLHIPGQKVVS